MKNEVFQILIISTNFKIKNEKMANPHPRLIYI